MQLTRDGKKRETFKFKISYWAKNFMTMLDLTLEAFAISLLLASGPVRGKSQGQHLGRSSVFCTNLLEADICRRVGMNFPQIQAFPITCIVMKRCYNSFEFSKLLTLQILQYWKGKTWNIWYPTPRMVYETRLWWTSDFTKFKKVLIWYLRIVLRSDVIPSGALLLRISPEW